MSFISRLMQRLSKKEDLGQNIQVLQKTFDIVINNSAPYELALTHRSATKGDDNERLELLGDAVLDLVVADHLYVQYPNLDEGKLTKLKAKLVSRERLSGLAINLGLNKNLMITRQRDLEVELIIGNVLEAIFGAMYLEQGFEVSKARAMKMMNDHVIIDTLLLDLVDAKSKLLELAQKKRWNISFVVREEPRSSDMKFSATVKWDERILGTGKGNSKKKAEKEASVHALETIQREL